MKQRFMSGFYLVLVVGLGLSLANPGTSVQAAEGSGAALTAAEDDGVYVGDAAAKVRSTCIGIWVYKKDPWGGWGWWCLGILK